MIKKFFSFIAIALIASIISAGTVGVYYATKYHAQVKIINERDKADVNPTVGSLNFGNMIKGSRKTKFITLTNKSNKDAYIYVYVRGKISPFIKLKKTFFTLRAKSSMKIGFSINVGNSIKYKDYEGTVFIFKLPKILKDVLSSTKKTL